MPILPRFSALLLLFVLTASFCCLGHPAACQESVDPALDEPLDQSAAIIQALHHNDLMQFSLSACPEVRLDRARGLVIIYLYQDNRAKPLDLKIDTVIAARIINKLNIGWVRAVEAHYFKDHDQSQFVMASIDMASVQQFAQGVIDQQTLLGQVAVEQNHLPGLKETYRGLSYRQILTGARVTARPAAAAGSGTPLRLVLTDSDKVE